MKRYLIFTYFMLFGLSLGFAQSGKVIDDIYVTPNDAQMVNEVKASKKAKERKESQQSAIYRNGAREIVFIDQYGNKTTAISDTVYIVDNEVYADTIVDEEGYYLNEFKGSKSDFEYAERIRKFHNPRYTITIADPGYNDVYFLDNNYWNVYMDGMYSTITPTWNNPYYWDYQYSPFSYNSWAWRYNWGYPSWGSYYGMGWSNPWYSGYYGWGGHYGWGGGWYDPWYSPWYSSYYGWGGYGWGYPYYGGYYGYGYGGYPYYGGGLGYGGWYDTTTQTSRRNHSGTRTIVDSNAASRRTSAINSGASATSSRSGYTTVSRQPASSATTGRTQNSAVGARSTRSSYSPNVNTNMRTGSVRTSQEWTNVRSNNTRTYSTPTSSGRSSSVINRTNPSSRGTVAPNSGRTTSTRSSYESSGSSSRSSSHGIYPSRSSGDSRSYESSSSSRSSSSGSYSSGSSSSRSSGGSYSSGSSSSSSSGSSRSSGGGGRR